VESKTDISQIKIKVEKLIHLHQQLNNEYARLKEDYDKLSTISDNQKKTIKDLQEANKLVRLAESISGSGQNTQGIKLKINEYIREIDRCMALLNN